MSYSSASTSSNNSVQASTSARAVEKPTVLVNGEAKDSVTVQSQLATSTVAGQVTSHSNIGQVITDLGSAHSANSGWMEAESQKINAWGQQEIQRILAQTKGMEQQLIKQAQEKQIALDNSHKGELAKLVQKLDLQKAAELKELEDALQRQIQGVLTTSKNDINRIETEMNNRKMELLKQSQIKSAKEIDALSNLVVETKLVPSQTRTVIETNTNTGSVLAVATGGTIATGQASSEAISSQKIAAIPNAGELRQETDVRTGDMVRSMDQRKVGEGAIVNSMTGVTEQRVADRGQPILPVGDAATHLRSGYSTTQGSSGYQQDSSYSQQGSSGYSQQQTSGSYLPGSGFQQQPSSGYTQMHSSDSTHSTSTAHGSNLLQKAENVLGMHDGQNVRKDQSGYDASSGNYKSTHVDAAYGKPHVGSNEPHHKEGLMDKVKHALTGHSTEPKSTDSHKRVY